ncbi:radical SAM protein [Brachyspira intermedia]|uniref:radical SAM protein n=1 Tax=Brachyspira intermedia TaxID=84377 RepID=UPI003003C48E
MHCLNVKVTYQCCNKCSYCFSNSYKNINISLEELKYAVSNGYDRGCRSIILSGGEPTYDEDKLISILNYAVEIGYEKFIIQSNGYGLIDIDSELFKLIKTISDNYNFSISFSVLGASADTHNKSTGNNDSFYRLMKSIENIALYTNANIYTNTVISSLNINELKDIIDMVIPFNPTIMQFSVMHIEDDNKYSVGLLETVKAINSIKNYISHDILRTEGIPYCLMRGIEKCVGESYWPSEIDLFNSKEENIFNYNQVNCGMRFKADFCKDCIFYDICNGVWKENKLEFLSLVSRAINAR